MVKGDYAVKFDFILSATFFNSFHFLVIIILLSLLRGLIWEVFIVIDSIIKNEPSQTAAFSLYFENSSIKKNKDDETKNKMAKKQIIFNKKTENQEIQLFSKDLGKTIASMNKTDNSKEIKLGIINENSLSDENSIQNILGKEKIHKKFEISENINEDSSSALYNYNEEKRKQFDFNNKFTDSIVKNPIICHENEIIIEKKSICQSDNTLKVEENHLVEMINRKKKSAPKISSEDSEEILNTKKAPINMNDKQKNIINFYKLKIKRLKYFLHLQDIQKKNSEKDKFDENSHFFHSKDKSSMKILEEYLLESLDDEELTNVFLPENELDPLCTDRFYKNEKGKKKQQGVQYGNNKNFLVKRALLKDFNMEQIKVFF